MFSFVEIPCAVYPAIERTLVCLFFQLRQILSKDTSLAFRTCVVLPASLLFFTCFTLPQPHLVVHLSGCVLMEQLRGSSLQ